MSKNLSNPIVKKVVEKYLCSRNFNGLSVGAPGIPVDIDEVAMLIENRALDLVRGDGHPNPHIKAFPAEPVNVQLEKIEKDGVAGCLYPAPEILKEWCARCEEKAPYTRELMEGSPQLIHKAFDLRSLEWYRNDPRFDFYNDDIHGRITLKEGKNFSGSKVARDNLKFFEFGFAYNSKMERSVAAFLRYLHDLPKEQQIEMKRHELSEYYDLHPDFYRTQIIGEFPERISIYNAFLEEKVHINQMCKLIGKPVLFRSEHGFHNRPLEFGILIRPTKKEFGDFALRLDQLLSDDINQKFFRGDVEGNKFTQQKGTIQLLEEWMESNFKTTDHEAVAKIFINMRAVRKARQKPAHMIEENDFDQKYVFEQRELIIKAFYSVRMLRMAFEKYPLARNYEVPDYLREGKVWTW